MGTGRRRAAPACYGRSGMVERLPVPTVWSVGLGSVVLWHWFWTGVAWEPPQNQGHSTIRVRPIDRSMQELLFDPQFSHPRLPK